MDCKAAPTPPSKNIGMKIAPKTAPSRTPSIKQATTLSQNPAKARLAGGSQCGETAAAATGVAVGEPAGGIAGMAAEVGAAVPQTWQKAEPGARLVPHFEQNMVTPLLEKDGFQGEMLQEAVR
jgi:hypothetical protein